MNSTIEISLTESQQKNIVREFVKGISDADLKWLFGRVISLNWDSRDHIKSLETFQKLVIQMCNLPGNHFK